MPHPAVDPFDVVAYVKQGLTAQEAAERMGFATATVRNAAGEIGLKFRDPRSPDDVTLARMVAMRESGATYAQIAAETGRCLSGVRKILIRTTKENTHV